MIAAIIPILNANHDGKDGKAGLVGAITTGFVAKDMTQQERVLGAIIYRGRMPVGSGWNGRTPMQRSRTKTGFGGLKPYRAFGLASFIYS